MTTETRKVHGPTCESCGDSDRPARWETLTPFIRVLDPGHAGAVQQWEQWEPACRRCAIQLHDSCGWAIRLAARGGA